MLAPTMTKSIELGSSVGLSILMELSGEDVVRGRGQAQIAQPLQGPKRLD